ncbi:hypothetical protein BRC81_08435 [Halobacteriales archaeon QS_1_68_20]|nr:MAG: hypothetical protein BRC81_08435 [Halobacteriales archaeon QS_1_68_20]
MKPPRPNRRKLLKATTYTVGGATLFSGTASAVEFTQLEYDTIGDPFGDDWYSVDAAVLGEDSVGDSDVRDMYKVLKTTLDHLVNTYGQLDGAKVWAASSTAGVEDIGDARDAQLGSKYEDEAGLWVTYNEGSKSRWNEVEWNDGDPQCSDHGGDRPSLYDPNRADEISTERDVPLAMTHLQSGNMEIAGVHEFLHLLIDDDVPKVREMTDTDHSPPSHTLSTIVEIEGLNLATPMSYAGDAYEKGPSCSSSKNRDGWTPRPSSCTAKAARYTADWVKANDC